MEVYKITNLINNKSYIGITKNNFYIRYGRRLDWWNAPKLNVILKNSINKHGFENFKVEILEKCLFVDELYFLEKYYIKHFDTMNPKYGYNLTSGGDKGYIVSEISNYKNSIARLNKPATGKNIKGHKKPKELIEKISKIKLDKYNKGELIPWNKGKKTGRLSEQAVLNSSRAHMKPVICYDLNNNFIKEYESIISAELDGFKSSLITLCCKYPEKHKTHRNCIFKYKK